MCVCVHEVWGVCVCVHEVWGVYVCVHEVWCVCVCVLCSSRFTLTRKRWLQTLRPLIRSCLL